MTVWFGSKCIQKISGYIVSPIQVIDLNEIPTIYLDSKEKENFDKFGSSITELEQRWLIQEVNDFLTKI